MKLTVIQERCPQNHRCPSLRGSPVGALAQAGFSAPEASREKCIACGKCVRFCPKQALILVEER